MILFWVDSMLSLYGINEELFVEFTVAIYEYEQVTDFLERHYRNY